MKHNSPLVHGFEHYTVGNGWSVHRRTHQSSASADLALLNITAAPDTDAFAWSAMLRLADRYDSLTGLTLYDTAYLELAQWLELPLAMLDQELHAAENTLGVSLLGSNA
jgi:predicted nucleic acid-binding protein